MAETLYLSRIGRWRKVVEGGRSIGQPKRYDQEFIVPLVCAKSCLFNICRMNPTLMIAHLQIELRKHRRLKQFVQKLVYDGNWKFIWYRQTV